MAYPPFPLSKVMSKMIAENGRPKGIYFVWFGSLMAVVFGGVYFLEHAPAGWTHGSSATVVVIALVVGVLVYVGWYNTREILICVTSEGLTVNLRRGHRGSSHQVPVIRQRMPCLTRILSLFL